MKKAMPAGRQGFTLIELLIVIAILGILAAGLLAALDPIDQLRRGRDSTRRTISVEYTNALNRFYSQTGVWPWGTANTAMTHITSGSTLGQLVSASELKNSFQAGVPTGTGIYFMVVSGAAFTCFQQEARAPNAADVYTSTAAGVYPATGATCSGVSGGTACIFCAR